MSHVPKLYSRGMLVGRRKRERGAIDLHAPVLIMPTGCDQHRRNTSDPHSSDQDLYIPAFPLHFPTKFSVSAEQVQLS